MAVFSVNFRGGFHLFTNQYDILGIANSYEQVEVLCYQDWISSYGHACRTYARQNWEYYNHWSTYPMPPLESFQQGWGPFVDGHQPPYRIKKPRFFATITTDIALALLCDIGQLAGFLGQGAQIAMMKEFMLPDEGKYWLEKQVYTALNAMGAYIMGTASPVEIPDEGCCTKPIMPQFSPDAGEVFLRSSLLIPGNIPATPLQEQDEYMRMDFNTLPRMD